MKSRWIVLAVVGGILLILILSLVGRYNSMVDRREQVENSWAQINNVLQRRADLVPNLVATVKGFAAQEREVFEQVSNARARLAGATGAPEDASPAEAAAANQQMNSALSRLLAISENYPELRSNENFLRLQDELAGTENRIAVERKRYNDAVRDYNRYIRRFPNNMFANMFGFERQEYFEVPEEARELPEVEFEG